MKTLIAMLAATMALAVPAGASTIVVNGSFETGVPGDVAGSYNGNNYGAMPGFGGWDIWDDLNGWQSVDGAPGIEAQTSGTLGFAAQDGDYYLELDTTSNSVMQQIVNLVAGAYKLSFWYAPRIGDTSTDGIGYTLGRLAAGSVNASVGDTVNGWSHIVAEFTVQTAGAYALTFAAEGRSDGLGGLIDNVSIDGIAAVPVPAAGFLLLGGLGALGALKRRRAV
jgi:hypothetical protein